MMLAHQPSDLLIARSQELSGLFLQVFQLLIDIRPFVEKLLCRLETIGFVVRYCVLYTNSFHVSVLVFF